MIPHGYHPNLGRSHCLSRGAPRMHFVLLLSRYRLNDFSITYSVFLMHRRTDLWGPDGKKLSLYMNFDSLGRRALALEFDPDRWLDERVKKYLIPNPFIFLPFNAGPRICLGQQVRYSPCHSLPPVMPISYHSSHTTKCLSCSSVYCKTFLQSHYHASRTIRPCSHLLGGLRKTVVRRSSNSGRETT